MGRGDTPSTAGVLPLPPISSFLRPPDPYNLIFMPWCFGAKMDHLFLGK